MQFEPEFTIVVLQIDDATVAKTFNWLTGARVQRH